MRKGSIGDSDGEALRAATGAPIEGLLPRPRWTVFGLAVKAVLGSNPSIWACPEYPSLMRGRGLFHYNEMVVVLRKTLRSHRGVIQG